MDSEKYSSESGSMDEMLNNINNNIHQPPESTSSEIDSSHDGFTDQLLMNIASSMLQPPPSPVSSQSTGDLIQNILKTARDPPSLASSSPSDISFNIPQPNVKHHRYFLETQSTEDDDDDEEDDEYCPRPPLIAFDEEDGIDSGMVLENGDGVLLEARIVKDTMGKLPD